MSAPAPDLREAPQLLPCPFCGGPGELLACNHGNLRVECIWCDATPGPRTPECVVESWNRRAALASQRDSRPYPQPQEHVTDAPGWLARRLAEDLVGSSEPAVAEAVQRAAGENCWFVAQAVGLRTANVLLDRDRRIMFFRSGESALRAIDELALDEGYRAVSLTLLPAASGSPTSSEPDEKETP